MEYNGGLIAGIDIAEKQFRLEYMTVQKAL